MIKIGQNTEAEKVPFKINVWCGMDPVSNQTGFSALDAMFDYMENTTYEHSYGSKKDQPLPDFVKEGWKLNQNSEYGELFTETLNKNDYQIHYVNESPYANGGAEQTTFFSDSREALETLCEDWGFDKSKIQEDKIVKQVL